MSERLQWECDPPGSSASGEDARAAARAGGEGRTYVAIRRRRRPQPEGGGELIAGKTAILVPSEEDVPRDRHDAPLRTRRDSGSPGGALACGCRGWCTCGKDGGLRDLVERLVGETVSVFVAETTFSGRLACAGGNFITVVRNASGGSGLDIAYLPIRRILGVRV